MTPQVPAQPNLELAGSKRKLRKGTFSCTECRRRKIRCKFSEGACACSHCLERGIRCIGQSEAQVSAQEKATLQDRITRLESLLQITDNPPHGISDRDHLKVDLFEVSAASSDLRVPLNGSSNQAPFVSFLDQSELLDSPHKVQETSGISSAPAASGLMARLNLPDAKARAVCERLRSALPRYDILLEVFSENGGWWTSFRDKTESASDEPFESLSAFATRCYTSNNPAELGILVTAFARSSNESNYCYTLVEKTIISDPSYSNTEDGMECLLLLAKSYTDIGYPRRAWYLYRQGIAIAQLMGFHRKRLPNPKREKLWWSAYHGDRFHSMLLGLPYGVIDDHYGITIDMSGQGSGLMHHEFTLKCALIAGKLIDRNVSPTKPSYAASVTLDDQMEEIETSMPERWWDTPLVLPAPGPELDELRKRALQQYFFFHIKMYIHLPFVAKASNPSQQKHSKIACIEAARQMVKLSLLFRTKSQDALFFECKTTNFVGFLAAVVLITGSSSSFRVPSNRVSVEDTSLVESMMVALEKEGREKGCKISIQCFRTLAHLIPHENCPSSTSLERIIIPYFGTMIRKQVELNKSTTSRSKSTNTALALSNSHILSTLPPGSTCSLIASEPSLRDTEIPHQQMDFGLSSLQGDIGWEYTDFSNFSLDNSSLWMDLGAIDIDQDWGMNFWDSDSFNYIQ